MALTAIHLSSSQGSRSSIATQEDAKNVASGADPAAEQAEAQGRPGTGTCAPNRDMQPKLDPLSRSKNQPYYSGNTLRISFCSCLQVINLLDTASKSYFAKSGLGKK
jgi:hypothetical protein